MYYLLVYFKIESEIAVKSYKQYFLFNLKNSIFCYSYNVLNPFSTNQNGVSMVYLSHDLANFLTYIFFHIAVSV